MGPMWLFLATALVMPALSALFWFYVLPKTVNGSAQRRATAELRAVETQSVIGDTKIRQWLQSGVITKDEFDTLQADLKRKG
jgi:hypothetical protein